ncbi:xanthine dehydrogenase family protein molybdopterin-binding subunit [Paludisphaera mucosa]|uniref:Xanthine dehydrogenase family protein molybdopterin-binding subunit n=1 Tax=Paludisphaera mucosa TaxID=3030827 RepID=A0ABT6FAI4_9BACT|nr:xanthine dehydrogenase family protein molybdopterin-binding subunit [Paludisphaera mucosa]MDG3004597.1 xanthine dehydrogenase family protein molybdopterin-binding subunit [Paludisphaera mucosa]
MSEVLNLSRRGFLRNTALAGGGLVLGVYLPQLAGKAANAADGAATFEPNAFVRIGSDESVTVISAHSEMGQGIYTGLAMIVAEELDADWSKVRVESAPADAKYNHTLYGAQITGGSTSTWTEWERLRKAGASARAMLVAAAAEEWGVSASSCTASEGKVLHAASGRSLSYGGLAARASKLSPPKDVTLKDPKTFKLIGKATKRLDTPSKTDGTAVFGLDVTLPGMLVALVARPPVFGGKVEALDATAALAVPGVRHVVEIDRGVAVAAVGFWAARKGREALRITWDHGPLAGLDSAKQGEEYAAMAKEPGAVARRDGDAEAALAKAVIRLDAVYELPYLAHAPMEPLNCVADVRPDGCDVWTGTQGQTFDHAVATQITGLKPEQVKVHTTLLGGGFGRRAAIDAHFVAEAVQLSKAVKAPVKVVWTREDDIRGGYYRPRAYHAIAGGLDAAGGLAAWRHKIVCQSFAFGTPFEKVMVKDGVDHTAVEGAADLPYTIPNLDVTWRHAPEGVPVIWLRSVGHTHTAFVVESFLDELAHAVGKDPFELRRGLLSKSPRHKRVLELAAEKAGWGTPLPPGSGRGIAVHESFASYVCHVAEVSTGPGGKLRVDRIVCAVDCGPIVNPDSIRAQMEGCVAFGLTTLKGEITFEDGRVKQRNFHDYPILRMNEMPRVEVHIVETTDKMGGVGEPGVPPVAPAVANAIFAAAGRRIRRLPFRPEDWQGA